MDNDGDLDVVAAYGQDVAPGVTENDAVVLEPSLTGGGALVAADVNGDGHLDVVSSKGPGAEQAVVQVLLGSAGRDGAQALVLVHGEADALTILLQTPVVLSGVGAGNGTFTFLAKIPDDPALAGSETVLQAAIADPGAVSSPFPGFALSNGVLLPIVK